MTNAEKFKQVFGFEPDTNEMIRGDCPDLNKDCKYYNYVEGCRCQDWWNEEFKNVCLDKEVMLNMLSMMPTETLQLAYLYAVNFNLTGDDVTKTWNTATQQAAIINRVYQRGYYCGLETANKKEETFDEQTHA